MDLPFLFRLHRFQVLQGLQGNVSALHSASIYKQPGNKTPLQPLPQGHLAVHIHLHAFVFSPQLPGRWRPVARDGICGWRHFDQRSCPSLYGGRDDSCYQQGGEGPCLCFQWLGQGRTGVISCSELCFSAAVKKCKIKGHPTELPASTSASLMLCYYTHTLLSSSLFEFI